MEDGARGARGLDRSAWLAVSAGGAYLLGTALWLLAGPFRELQARGGVLDTKFGAGAKGLHDALVALGGDGRTLYQTFLVLDMSYAVYYGVCLVVVAWWAAHRLGLRLLPWMALPVAGAALDILEDALFLGLVGRYPADPEVLAWFASLAMHAKLLTLAAVHVALVVLVVRAARSPAPAPRPDAREAEPARVAWTDE